MEKMELPKSMEEMGLPKRRKLARAAVCKGAIGQSRWPAGARNRETLAAAMLLDGEAEVLTRKAVELALAGDPTALRLCLSRCHARVIPGSSPGRHPGATDVAPEALGPRFRGCRNLVHAITAQLQQGRACFETRPSGAPQHEVCD